jgi:hypothetical protein
MDFALAVEERGVGVRTGVGFKAAFQLEARPQAASQILLPAQAEKDSLFSMPVVLTWSWVLRSTEVLMRP